MIIVDLLYALKWRRSLELCFKLRIIQNFKESIDILVLTKMRIIFQGGIVPMVTYEGSPFPEGELFNPGRIHSYYQFNVVFPVILIGDEYYPQVVNGGLTLTSSVIII